jgi:hypothetical protein
LARIRIEKQEEIPKENDDKYVDILDVIVRNATRPRQEQNRRVLDTVESHGGRMYSENNPYSEGDAYN